MHVTLVGAAALVGLAIAQSNTDLSQKYVPSPGSPGFYVGNSSAAVTFDQHSLMLNGKRIMVFSGEFHPWRLPSTPLWRDVLEKMKAAGFNAVSIYLHWGLTESKRGILNFEGHRSVTKFLDVAKDVGILVIVRPGPYINAETAGGGYPGWLSNVQDTARSNGSDFTAAWKPYIQEVSKFTAPYQYPDGPVILMQSENEYSMDNPSDKTTYGHTDHMEWIIEEMRANGITRVPITHNDRKPDGQFASGPAKVDLYVLTHLQHLQLVGQRAYQKYHAPPALLVIVLPSNSADLYQAVKHFGDTTRGVATQCLKGSLARGAKEQYWANVCLKINAKLGGTNTKLNAFDNPSWIFDPDHPVMIIASHVMHPAPGAYGRPSFASVVGSLDSDIVHYSAVSSAQGSRVNLIHDLEGAIYELIGRHAWWKTNREKQTKSFPERVIYYRHGVPDNEFPQVLSIELPAIQAASKRHKINPKITIIIVGQGHHVRFFPTHGMADAAGNCPAGTVVDSVVGNPQEFDFYLQSHSTPVGTARPMHYSVIFDQNDFSQDGIQELTYALCQISARTTRSLSIPAPLHYAHMVSERAKNHYDPSLGCNDIDEEDDANGEDAAMPTIQRYRDLFKPPHETMRYRMYFQ